MSSTAVAADEPFTVDAETRAAPAPAPARQERTAREARVKPAVIASTLLVLQLAWFAVLAYGLYALLT